MLVVFVRRADKVWNAVMLEKLTLRTAVVVGPQRFRPLSVAEPAAFGLVHQPAAGARPIMSVAFCTISPIRYPCIGPRPHGTHAHWSPRARPPRIFLHVPFFHRWRLGPRRMRWGWGRIRRPRRPSLIHGRHLAVAATGVCPAPPWVSETKWPSFLRSTLPPGADVLTRTRT